MKIRTRVLLGSICLIIIFIISLEMVLRMKYGLCDAPLSTLSEKYEYCFAPNQDRVRFGNRVKYNSYSMRSDEVNDDALKILIVGDSVVNGGVLVDQDNLTTSILTKRLTEKFKHPVQVLNISAGSWGPSNCAAFLEEKGLFDAKGIIVLLSGYDIQDFMSFDWEYYTNSVHKIHLPLKQYSTAVSELWFRYRKPVWQRVAKVLKIPQASKPTLADCKYDVDRGPDAGYETLGHMAQKANIPIYYCLHPVIEEVEGGAYSDFSMKTVALMEELDITVIHSISNGLDKACYLDGIHLNTRGHERMADILEPVILKILTQVPAPLRNN